MSRFSGPGAELVENAGPLIGGGDPPGGLDLLGELQGFATCPGTGIEPVLTCSWIDLV